MSTLSRKTRVWLVILAVAAFFGIVHGVHRSLDRQMAEQETQPQPTLTSGMNFPAGFDLENVGTKKAVFSEFRGKVVLINFWAGWCGPCLHEMPGLYSLQKKLEGRGLVVLGVNMDDDPLVGMKVLRQRVGDAPFPIYKGTGTAFADKFEIDGLPFTVVVDRNSTIRYARSGEVNWQSPDAVGLIEGLL
ncbi:MAG TPA: TlpA disulfide reductase family protein [Bdellovibrionota bacterium]|jgi:thiol-disulfide isomerase/thioredoxin